MSDDTRSIKVFGTAIDFAVSRNSRRRNISIEIAAGGQVVVKAPPSAADSQLERVVKEHAKWILAKLAEAETDQPQVASRRFADGELLLFRGSEHTLILVEATTAFPVGEVKLEDGEIKVSVFTELAGNDPASAVRKPLVQWYKRQAQDILPARVGHFAKQFGVSVSQVLIRDQQRRWGSCNSKGVIRINYRIIMAPPEVTDYVVAHEVCHLLEMNHSAAYWNKLEAVMPNYRASRHELKKHGQRLVL